MATTRWRSSLANIETALRRSLGISGPIDLQLPEPTTLQPVIIAGDATRPGTASQLRGRRFRNTRTFSVNAAATGCYFLLCEEPAVSSGIRPNIFDGGAVIDAVTVSMNSAVAGTVYHLAIVYYPHTQVLAGVPAGPGLFDVFFVDPMRVVSEPAPLSSAVDGAASVTTGGGIVIWETQINTNPVSGPVRIPLDLFLNWRSGLVIGNRTVSAQAVTLYVNVEGRIF